MWQVCYVTKVAFEGVYMTQLAIISFALLATAPDRTVGVRDQPVIQIKPATAKCAKDQSKQIARSEARAASSNEAKEAAQENREQTRAAIQKFLDIARCMDPEL